MKTAIRANYCSITLLCLSLVEVGTATAVCNNPNNWLQAPGRDTKVFIGYKQEQSPGFDDITVSSHGHDYPYPQRCWTRQVREY